MSHQVSINIAQWPEDGPAPSPFVRAPGPIFVLAAAAWALQDMAPAVLLRGAAELAIKVGVGEVGWAGFKSTQDSFPYDILLVSLWINERGISNMCAARKSYFTFKLWYLTSILSSDTVPIWAGQVVVPLAAPWVKLEWASVAQGNITNVGSVLLARLWAAVVPIQVGVRVGRGATWKFP